MKRITDLQGSFELHNGVQMPYFGLGVYQSEDGNEVINAVKTALNHGYRHIDTAAIYYNEEGVGTGIRKSNVDRKDVFLTSKVWNTDQGYDSTLKAFDASLERLGTDYLDLYLVHWPKGELSKETWKALEKLYKEKRVRAIGVSNFLRHHLEDLLTSVEIVPMVNQMEFHPYLVQQDLVDFCNSNGIQYQAWSPLMQGNIFDLDIMKDLTLKYNKTIAQIVLRWDLQKGVVTIPKSSKKERIVANSDLFNFELSEEDVQLLDGLDKGKRFGPDPDNFDF
ncbi:Methylglyoxal reductase (NADPH-dependent) [Allomuricauda ruestringensis DSM 13258]|uniref:Methylglyoxal reductase (NADPH-dependent) n=1 Tax=Allomuricauda ruestringensis (strain DSM 13258 / CIP 107369 / LMG 19739 / B1) TaxID=886377 RepID=G2PPR5_ALLRU|nr:aldo/keto reductase [Allomuricauda ruestringensis]AEM70446.1 Methylglyoxal reductase (NADPH-dependent) [Allomuricauda ruestringensis DSM 13258]